jgi:hypothetical protein
MTSRRARELASAVLHEETVNRKLAPIVLVPYSGKGSITARPTPGARKCSATYASIEATCPSSCEWKRGGCFVRSGFTGRMSDELDHGARHKTGDVVAYEESQAIDRGFGGERVPQDGGRDGKSGRDLRLHIGGDVPSTRGLAWLERAAYRWRERGGGEVWTYTHRYAEIPRRAWASISVLASVESEATLAVARAAGYVPAVVVSRFPDGPKAFSMGGFRVVPCPAEVGKVTCIDCRLCLDDRKLAKRGLAIGFEAHGRDASQMRTRLQVLPGGAA